MPNQRDSSKVSVNTYHDRELVAAVQAYARATDTTVTELIRRHFEFLIYESLIGEKK